MAGGDRGRRRHPARRGRPGEVRAGVLGRRAASEYNDYFGMPYPLPKLDNVASPGRSQFFGAMENWGAIFTFEYALLLDPTISTQSDKQGVFSIAAHEIAHQWFGDLVTMSWWDDLWLNEGFATWMAGAHHRRSCIRNGTPCWARSASAKRRWACDAVATTHPVVQHVETVEQASQAFDAITYQKGEAVIRMLEGYVGADAWRDGVRSYMKTHAYGNTMSDDLWRAVQAAAGKPIVDIAHDFTLQPGVPLIRVESATCNGGKTTLQLTQGEFTQGPPGQAAAGVARAGDRAERRRRSRRARWCRAARARWTCRAAARWSSTPARAATTARCTRRAQFAQSRDGFAKLAPIDQLGLMGDTWALGMAGPAAAVGLPRPRDARAGRCRPADLGRRRRQPRIARPLLRGRCAAPGDASASSRSRRCSRCSRAWAGTPSRARPTRSRSCARTLIGTLGAAGRSRGRSPKRVVAYAAQTSDPTAMPARAAQARSSAWSPRMPTPRRGTSCTRWRRPRRRRW